MTGLESVAVVVLTCKGGHFAKVIGSRYLVAPCRKGRCRTMGEHTYHVWDLLTGRMTTMAHEPTVRGPRTEGDSYAVR